MSRPSPQSFELRNAGVGPDPLSLSEVAARVEFAILFLLRDSRCPECKAQVWRAADQAEELERRDTAVLAVLPESFGTAQIWQRKYGLPFPLLADPEGDVGEAYGQSRRADVSDGVASRLPKAVLLDLRGEPAVIEEHDGDGPADRPRLADLLAAVDERREEFVFGCDLVEC